MTVRAGVRLLLLILLGVSTACGSPRVRPPLIFAPAELPTARVGEVYRVTVTVANNETPLYSMTVKAETLPEGLVLLFDPSASSAEIRGIPEAAGMYTFTITASCLGTSRNGQVGEMQYTLTVR